MNKKSTKILLVDDEPTILKTLAICFEDLGFSVNKFLDPQEAANSVAGDNFDIAFIDLKMSPIDGLQLLEEIKSKSPHTTVIIITAHGSIESAIEAIKKGAYDYLQKPFDYNELQLYARRVWDYHKLKTEVTDLRNRISQLQDMDLIITRDHKMRELINLADRAAGTDLAILIEGESGTGKELFAQRIFEKSSRLDNPFIKINCAAVPENLLESEFFGHIKGAFTGAIRNREGRFEAADGGTIFLDEIAELSPSLQAKLLRFLQSREFERVGESQTIKVDVRIIAATNRDLEKSIQEGHFREDLFYRLNSVHLKIPPLRQRIDDIPLLIQAFITKFSPGPVKQITPEALNILRYYEWKGNVRELENTIERIVLLSANDTIDVRDIPEKIRRTKKSMEKLKTLNEVEKEHIQFVLQNAINLQQAAEILDIDPATLWRKRKKYHI